MAAARTVGPISGTNLLLIVASNAVATSTNCSCVLNTDMRDISNKDSAGWKSVLPGMRNWTLSTEGLISFDQTYNYTYFMNLQINKTRVAVKFQSTNTAGDIYFSGYAYVTSVSASAQNEANATFTVSMVGDGALTAVDPLTP